MTTTCIRQLEWLVAWDAAAGRHIYQRNGDLAFTGNQIIHVGGRFEGPADTVIDGKKRMAIPGLVSVHGHPTQALLTRGVREEMGNPLLYNSALYDRSWLWRTDQDGLLSGAEAAYCELIRSGVTTAIDYPARVPEGWIDLLARTGLRVYAAPSYRDAKWVVPNGRRLDYAWDEDQGRREMEAALTLVDAASSHPSGRLSGMLAPAQADTCTVQTLQSSLDAAKKRNMPMQVHVAQSLPEFHEMIRRNGCTPIEWLKDIGVLDPCVSLAHCIFLDCHPWTHWGTRRDLAILAETGVTVAHCPLVFTRYGQMLHSFGAYRRAGVAIGIGTDTAPMNMLEEMRQALYMTRCASGSIDDASTRDVFDAATIGGAGALGRSDIGRLAVGAKADIALVDIGAPSMRPLRDPLRSLIYAAADRAVTDTFVDGKAVMRDRRILTIDEDGALDRLEIAQRAAEAGVPKQHPDGLSGTDLAPLVLPLH